MTTSKKAAHGADKARIKTRERMYGDLAELTAKAKKTAWMGSDARLHMLDTMYQAANAQVRVNREARERGDQAAADQAFERACSLWDAIHEVKLCTTAEQVLDYRRGEFKRVLSACSM